MAEQKITRKQMFEHIAEVMADDLEVVEFCNHQIEMINNRKATPRKANPEVVAFRENVLAYINEIEGEVTAKQAAEDLSGIVGFSVSVQKASAALRFLAEQGDVVAHDNGNKAKTYSNKLATEDFEDPVEEF